MFIPSDCWWFVPSLSGLPLVPVPLALWSAVPSFVLHFAWPFGAAGAATAPLSGSPVLFVRVSFVWGWLRFWASVGPFVSLVCLRGLLLLLPLPRLPFACALSTWGQFTSFFFYTQVVTSWTCHFLDLSVAGEPGARQHIVRDAWRAWCLQRHMSSSRRDADLDCFDEYG